MSAPNKRVDELRIDGCAIYIEELEQLSPAENMHDSGGVTSRIISWSTQEIEQAINPVMSIWKSLRNAASKTLPNEMELSMQFEISLKGETPILKIVSTESAAQIAVKFTWKNDPSE